MSYDRRCKVGQVNTFGNIVGDYMMFKPRTKLRVVNAGICNLTAAAIAIRLQIKLKAKFTPAVGIPHLT